MRGWRFLIARYLGNRRRSTADQKPRTLKHLFRALAAAEQDDSEDRAALDRVAELWDQVLDHPQALAEPDMHPPILNGAGWSRLRRYLACGTDDDLRAALMRFEQAVQVAPAGSWHYLDSVENSSNAMRLAFERYGNEALLDQSIALAVDALEDVPEPDPTTAGLCNVLALARYARYKNDGRETDLTGAIGLIERAIATAPDDTAQSGYRNNLGLMLLAGYDQSGDPVLAETAQHLFSGDSGRPLRGWPGLLTNNASGLRTRYLQAASAEDLSGIVTAASAAVDHVAPLSPLRPGYLHNLGMALWDRHGRTGSLSDLDDAIAAFRESLAGMQDQAPDLARVQAALATALLDRAERRGRSGPVEEALVLLTSAVARTKPTSPDFPAWVGALGNANSARYRSTNDGANRKHLALGFGWLVWDAPDWAAA